MSERKTEAQRSQKSTPLGGIIASLDRRYQRQLLMVLLAFLAFNVRTNRLDIRIAKGGTEENVVFSKWNSFSRVTVERVFDVYRIEIDSDAATYIEAGTSEGLPTRPKLAA